MPVIRYTEDEGRMKAGGLGEMQFTSIRSSHESPQLNFLNMLFPPMSFATLSNKFLAGNE